MKDKQHTTIVSFGLPIIDVCHLVDDVDFPGIDWLICDADIDALCVVEQRFQARTDVSVCLIPAFGPRDAEAVRTIVSHESREPGQMLFLYLEKDLPPHTFDGVNGWNEGHMVALDSGTKEGQVTCLQASVRKTLASVRSALQAPSRPRRPNAGVLC